MVRRMTGRMHGGQRGVARGNLLVVLERGPCNGPLRVTFGPEHLAKPGAPMLCRDRRRSRCVVRVRVCDEHLCEGRVTERASERLEMRRLADTGVDQRR